MGEVLTAALIGGGVIGGGWAARFVRNGIDVRVYDPDAAAERKVAEVLSGAARAYGRLYDAPPLREGSVRFCATIAEAVAGADLVVESVPERLEVKRAVYAQVEAANATAVIASSTSGIMPSDLQAEMAHPERLIVAHPFNPVYLLPLVELVAGDKTDPAKIDWAKGFYQGLGMHPLHCRVEIEGFLSDRLQEALWREALWLLHDEVATADELDAAIAYGPGLRWAQMGTMQTFHLAGGEAGMRGMLAMFGPCLKWPWTKLMDVPDLTDAFVDRVGDQCDAQAGDLTPRDLERIRDDNLVGILHALRRNDWGAGRTLPAPPVSDAAPDWAGPVETLRRHVPFDWLDYNGHMNEARYLDAFCAGTDRLMEMIGADADYVAGGMSYFTAETHIRHLDEARKGDEIHVTTQILSGAGKKLRLFHRMWRGADLLATGEHMLIHVDLSTRRACAPSPEVAQMLDRVATAHATLPLPEGAGRAVGAPRWPWRPPTPPGR